MADNTNNTAAMNTAESDADVPMQDLQRTEPAGEPGRHNLSGVLDSLEVDASRPDSDSSLGSEVSSMTTSLRSEAYEFNYEHGRRYQSGNDKYHLPNDIASLLHSSTTKRTLT